MVTKLEGAWPLEEELFLCLPLPILNPLPIPPLSLLVVGTT